MWLTCGPVSKLMQVCANARVCVCGQPWYASPCTSSPCPWLLPTVLPVQCILRSSWVWKEAHAWAWEAQGLQDDAWGRHSIMQDMSVPPTSVMQTMRNWERHAQLRARLVNCQAANYAMDVALGAPDAGSGEQLAALASSVTSKSGREAWRQFAARCASVACSDASSGRGDAAPRAEPDQSAPIGSSLGWLTDVIVKDPSFVASLPPVLLVQLLHTCVAARAATGEGSDTTSIPDAVFADVVAHVRSMVFMVPFNVAQRMGASRRTGGKPWVQAASASASAAGDTSAGGNASAGSTRSTPETSADALAFLFAGLASPVEGTRLEYASVLRTVVAEHGDRGGSGDGVSGGSRAAWCSTLAQLCALLPVVLVAQRVVPMVQAAVSVSSQPGDTAALLQFGCTVCSTMASDPDVTEVPPLLRWPLAVALPVAHMCISLPTHAAASLRLEPPAVDAATPALASVSWADALLQSVPGCPPPAAAKQAGLTVPAPADVAPFRSVLLDAIVSIVSSVFVPGPVDAPHAVPHPAHAVCSAVLEGLGSQHGSWLALSSEHRATLARSVNPAVAAALSDAPTQGRGVGSAADDAALPSEARRLLAASSPFSVGDGALHDLVGEVTVVDVVESRAPAVAGVGTYESVAAPVEQTAHVAPTAAHDDVRLKLMEVRCLSGAVIRSSQGLHHHAWLCRLHVWLRTRQLLRCPAFRQL